MKNKPKKLTNRELIEDFLKEFEFLGYSIENKRYMDGYFIFDYGTDSVCWFNIKGLPGWRFALWNAEGINKKYLATEYGVETAELIFFTQYEKDIDKFKPSRSGFKTAVYRQRYSSSNPGSDKIMQIDEWSSMYYIIDLLDFIKKHPYMAREYSFLETTDITSYRSPLKCVMSIIDRDFYDFRHNIYKKIYMNWCCTLAKIKLRKTKHVSAFLYDRGLGWHPRREITILEDNKPKTKKEEAELDKLYKWTNKYDNSIISFDWIDNAIYYDRRYYYELQETVVQFNTGFDEERGRILWIVKE